MQLPREKNTLVPYFRLQSSLLIMRQSPAQLTCRRHLRRPLSLPLYGPLILCVNAFFFPYEFILFCTPNEESRVTSGKSAGRYSRFSLGQFFYYYDRKGVMAPKFAGYNEHFKVLMAKRLSYWWGGWQVLEAVHIFQWDWGTQSPWPSLPPPPPQTHSINAFGFKLSLLIIWERGNG